jgi:hypothetical protein
MDQMRRFRAAQHPDEALKNPCIDAAPLWHAGFGSGSGTPQPSKQGEGMYLDVQAYILDSDALGVQAWQAKSPD